MFRRIGQASLALDWSRTAVQTDSIEEPAASARSAAATGQSAGQKPVSGKGSGATRSRPCDEVCRAQGNGAMQIRRCPSLVELDFPAFLASAGAGTDLAASFG